MVNQIHSKQMFNIDHGFLISVISDHISADISVLVGPFAPNMSDHREQKSTPVITV